MKHTVVYILLAWAITQATGFAGVPEVTKSAYEKRSPDSGIVLVSVNWGRRWNCPPYENAELRMLSFDLAGRPKATADEPADFIMEGPPRLLTKPEFKNYAVLLPAGTYNLSGFSIKVAKSMSEVGYLRASRNDLIPSGESKGGSFTLNPGETVYIGNFFLDCANGPMLWRYYSEQPDGFPRHITEFSGQYPFLDLRNVQYRLFKTSMFGLDYPTDKTPPLEKNEASPAPAAPAKDSVNSLIGRGQ